MNSRWKLIAGMTVFLLVLASSVMVSRNVTAAAEGKVTGTVKLDGTAPHERPIDMSKEPTCQKEHAANPVRTENVVAGPNGGLEWVAIYISEGLSAGAASAAPAQEQNWDQKGCQYIPHVMAMDVGEHFKVVNSDQTSHNIHPLPKPGSGNNQWNKSQPPGSPPFDISWSAEEVAIPVKCNIHPWMHGYMAVVKGPNGVSDNNGAYTIEGVPPGSYTLTAWQETYGMQTQKITVAAGKAATADFTFKAK